MWSRILRSHQKFLSEYRDRIEPAYLEGFEQLDLDPFDVPSVNDLNRRLAAIGWSTVAVDGYLPTAAYAKLLTQRIFPVAASLRRIEHIEHSPAPDLAHDVLGHLPLLFCPQYRAYLRRLAALMAAAPETSFGRALYAANRRLSMLIARSAPAADIADAERLVDQARLDDRAHPSEEREIGRIFLWSIEFGLVGTASDYKLFGAGLLSSPRESRLACRPKALVRSYSLGVLHHDIEFTTPQEQYFVSSGYGAFHDVLDRYESLLAARCDDQRGARVAAYA